MQRFNTLLPFLLLFSLLIGCSHTNELAKYQLSGQRFYSESNVSPDAAEVNVMLTHTSTGNAITDILVAVGEGITAAQAQEKLQRAIKPAGVATNIAQGFGEDLTKYLNVRIVNTLSDNPDLIVRTQLEDLKIQSAPSGVFMHVRAECTVIYRQTAAVIWQNTEEVDMPVRRTDAFVLDPTGGTITGIVNVVELLKMTEQEIQDLVLRAASGVGFRMGETLREDVAKMKR